MSFSQALSGLHAASKRLSNIGNNIANANTYGFKNSTLQFADVYAGADIGQGVSLKGVLQDFSNGTLKSTGRDLDLGINGKGFFRFSQGGEIVYSRNGQLTMTKDGYLVNASGARITGYAAGVDTGGQPSEIQVPSSAMNASATSKVNLAFNLDASTAPTDRAVTPFDATDADTYDYSNTGIIYDSLGNQHFMTTYYTKTDTNTWEVQVAVDGNPGVGNGQLVFNSNSLLDPAASTFPAGTYDPGNGAATMNFAVDLGGTTQSGNDFALNSQVQNGYAAGALVGIQVADDGTIVGNYSNEQQRTLGTLALVNFRNPEGLERIGDNAWRATGASGQALLGQAGEGMLGTLEGGTLEQSNVDLSGQLVNLIIAQRGFQANTQTIKVQSQVLQDIVRIG